MTKRIRIDDIGKRKVKIIETGIEGVIMAAHTSYEYSSWIKIDADDKRYHLWEFEFID